MRRSALGIVASLLLAGAACEVPVSQAPSSSPSEPGPPTNGTPPPPPPANGAPNPQPGPAPKPLPGTEDLVLEGREKALFAQMTSELYAPCTSQAVPLQQCVSEHRSCAACVPAVRLLAQKIHEGAGADDARKIFALRFGPDVKKVDVADSPARGPVNAPVTLIVFSDFECPHCKHAMPLLDQMVGKYDGKVRLVHKFYPLRQHAHAEAAARAAIAAQNQGHYWEMERVLFDHQDAQSDADLAGYAADLKLDMRKWTLDLSADRTTKILARDRADAERAGLEGTPFILVNGRVFDSSYFHLGPDLDAWIALELELAGQR